MNVKLEPKDWLTIIVMVAGFTTQYITVRNDVDYIKQTLTRHERLYERLLVAAIGQGK